MSVLDLTAHAMLFVLTVLVAVRASTGRPDPRRPAGLDEEARPDR